MKRTGVLVFLLVGFLVACGSDAPPAEDADPTPSPTETVELEPEAIHVTGAVALGGGAVIHDLPEQGQCTAHSGYADIKPGIQVVIHDASGAIVATAELGDGARYGESEDCVWPFDAEVPAGGRFYSASLLDWESDAVAEEDLATTIVAILPAG